MANVLIEDTPEFKRLRVENDGKKYFINMYLTKDKSSWMYAVFHTNGRRVKQIPLLVQLTAREELLKLNKVLWA